MVETGTYGNAEVDCAGETVVRSREGVLGSSNMRYNPVSLTEIQVSLLAEIIKLSSVPANALLKLIRDFDVPPRWDDIPLPEGTLQAPVASCFFRILCHSSISDLTISSQSQ